MVGSPTNTPDWEGVLCTSSGWTRKRAHWVLTRCIEVRCNRPRSKRVMKRFRRVHAAYISPMSVLPLSSHVRVFQGGIQGVPGFSEHHERASAVGIQPSDSPWAAFAWLV